MKTSVSMSHSDMTIDVINACGERVCVFGNIGNYQALVVQIPPDEALRIALDLMVAAYRIEPFPQPRRTQQPPHSRLPAGLFLPR